MSITNPPCNPYPILYSYSTCFCPHSLIHVLCFSHLLLVISYLLHLLIYLDGPLCVLPSLPLFYYSLVFVCFIPGLCTPVTVHLPHILMCTLTNLAYLFPKSVLPFFFTSYRAYLLTLCTLLPAYSLTNLPTVLASHPSLTFIAHCILGLDALSSFANPIQAFSVVMYPLPFN